MAILHPALKMYEDWLRTKRHDSPNPQELEGASALALQSRDCSANTLALQNLQNAPSSATALALQNVNASAKSSSVAWHDLEISQHCPDTFCARLKKRLKPPPWKHYVNAAGTKITRKACHGKRTSTVHELFRALRSHKEEMAFLRKRLPKPTKKAISSQEATGKPWVVTGGLVRGNETINACKSHNSKDEQISNIILQTIFKRDMYSTNIIEDVLSEIIQRIVTDLGRLPLSLPYFAAGFRRHFTQLRVPQLTILSCVKILKHDSKSDIKEVAKITAQTLLGEVHAVVISGLPKGEFTRGKHYRHEEMFSGGACSFNMPALPDSHEISEMKPCPISVAEKIIQQVIDRFNMFVITRLEMIAKSEAECTGRTTTEHDITGHPNSSLSEMLPISPFGASHHKNAAPMKEQIVFKIKVSNPLLILPSFVSSKDFKKRLKRVYVSKAVLELYAKSALKDVLRAIEVELRQGDNQMDLMGADVAAIKIICSITGMLEDENRSSLLSKKEFKPLDLFNLPRCQSRIAPYRSPVNNIKTTMRFPSPKPDGLKDSFSLRDPSRISIIYSEQGNNKSQLPSINPMLLNQPLPKELSTQHDNHGNVSSLYNEHSNAGINQSRVLRKTEYPLATYGEPKTKVSRGQTSEDMQMDSEGVMDFNGGSTPQTITTPGMGNHLKELNNKHGQCLLQTPLGARTVKHPLGMQNAINRSIQNNLKSASTPLTSYGSNGKNIHAKQVPIDQNSLVERIANSLLSGFAFVTTNTRQDGANADYSVEHLHENIGQSLNICEALPSNHSPDLLNGNKVEDLIKHVFDIMSDDNCPDKDQRDVMNSIQSEKLLSERSPPSSATFKHAALPQSAFVKASSYQCDFSQSSINLINTVAEKLVSALLGSRLSSLDFRPQDAICGKDLKISTDTQANNVEQTLGAKELLKMCPNLDTMEIALDQHKSLKAKSSRKSLDSLSMTKSMAPLQCNQKVESSLRSPDSLFHFKSSATLQRNQKAESSLNSSDSLSMTKSSATLQRNQKTESSLRSPDSLSMTKSTANLQCNQKAESSLRSSDSLSMTKPTATLQYIQKAESSLKSPDPLSMTTSTAVLQCNHTLNDSELDVLNNDLKIHVKDILNINGKRARTTSPPSIKDPSDVPLHPELTSQQWPPSISSCNSTNREVANREGEKKQALPVAADTMNDMHTEPFVTRKHKTMETMNLNKGDPNHFIPSEVPLLPSSVGDGLQKGTFIWDGQKIMINLSSEDLVKLAGRKIQRTIFMEFKAKTHIFQKDIEFCNFFSEPICEATVKLVFQQVLYYTHNGNAKRYDNRKKQETLLKGDFQKVSSEVLSLNGNSVSHDDLMQHISEKEIHEMRHSVMGLLSQKTVQSPKSQQCTIDLFWLSGEIVGLTMEILVVSFFTDIAHLPAIRLPDYKEGIRQDHHNASDDQGVGPKINNTLSAIEESKELQTPVLHAQKVYQQSQLSADVTLSGNSAKPLDSSVAMTVKKKTPVPPSHLKMESEQVTDGNTLGISNIDNTHNNDCDEESSEESDMSLINDPHFNGTKLGNIVIQLASSIFPSSPSPNKNQSRQAIMTLDSKKVANKLILEIKDEFWDSIDKEFELYVYSRAEVKKVAQVVYRKILRDYKSLSELQTEIRKKNTFVVHNIANAIILELIHKRPQAFLSSESPSPTEDTSDLQVSLDNEAQRDTYGRYDLRSKIYSADLLEAMFCKLLCRIFTSIYGPNDEINYEHNEELLCEIILTFFNSVSLDLTEAHVVIVRNIEGIECFPTVTDDAIHTMVDTVFNSLLEEYGSDLEVYKHIAGGNTMVVTLINNLILAEMATFSLERNVLKVAPSTFNETLEIAFMVQNILTEVRKAKSHRQIAQTLSAAIWLDILLPKIVFYVCHPSYKISPHCVCQPCPSEDNCAQITKRLRHKVLESISGETSWNMNNSNSNSCLQDQVDFEAVAQDVSIRLLQFVHTPEAAKEALITGQEFVFDLLTSAIISDMSLHLKPLLSGKVPEPSHREKKWYHKLWKRMKRCRCNAAGTGQPKEMSSSTEETLGTTTVSQLSPDCTTRSESLLEVDDWTSESDSLPSATCRPLRKRISSAFSKLFSCRRSRRISSIG
ncbi:uncharacterized protein [Ambystoma mexicanum]|uniref:uncharacterized protein n=1 Tax=Ambystoma mexicanum TaxID=8296 RepID=UPI0037E82FF3